MPELKKCPLNLVGVFHFVGWGDLSLGIHVSFSAWNVEIHLPFGFIRVGLEDDMTRAVNYEEIMYGSRYAFRIPVGHQRLEH